MARMHRTNKRNVISLVGDVREQITHFNSTLTARRKLPIRSLQEYFLISWTIACLGVIKDDLFTMVFNQLWFRVKRIDVRDTSAHEKKNDRLGLRWEMWLFWRSAESAARISLRMPGINNELATADRTKRRRLGA
jgi:hypothetical protein